MMYIPSTCVLRIILMLLAIFLTASACQNIRSFFNPQDTFTEINNPPILQSPVDQQIISADQLALVWQDETKGSEYYYIYIDGVLIDHLSKSANQTTTTYIVNDVELSFSPGGESHHWYIEARNDFQKIKSEPGSFKLVGPADLGEDMQTCPGESFEVEWDDLGNDVKYNIELSMNSTVSEDDSFADILYIEEGMTSTSFVANDLQPNTTYYWHLQAIFPGEEDNTEPFTGPWSTLYEIEVLPPIENPSPETTDICYETGYAELAFQKGITVESIQFAGIDAEIDASNHAIVDTTSLSPNQEYTWTYTIVEGECSARFESDPVYLFDAPEDAYVQVPLVCLLDGTATIEFSDTSQIEELKLDGKPATLTATHGEIDISSFTPESTYTWTYMLRSNEICSSSFSHDMFLYSTAPDVFVESPNACKKAGVISIQFTAGTLINNLTFDGNPVSVSDNQGIVDISSYAPNTYSWNYDVITGSCTQNYNHTATIYSNPTQPTPSFCPWSYQSIAMHTVTAELSDESMEYEIQWDIDPGTDETWGGIIDLGSERTLDHVFTEEGLYRFQGRTRDPATGCVSDWIQSNLITIRGCKTDSGDTPPTPPTLWPNAYGDIRNTGISGSSLNLPLSLKWESPAVGVVVSSPIVVDDQYVYALCVDPAGSKIKALDISDGSVAMESADTFPAVSAWSSAGVESGNGRIYGSTSTELYAVKKTDLTNEWRITLVGGNVNSTPRYYNEKLFVVTSDKMYAVDASDGAILWEDPISNSYNESTPAIFQNMTIISSWGGPGPSHVAAYDIDTGVIQWQFDCPHPSAFFVCPVVIHNHTAYASTYDFSFGVHPPLYALDVFTGEPLWCNPAETTMTDIGPTFYNYDPILPGGFEMYYQPEQTFRVDSCTAETVWSLGDNTSNPPSTGGWKSGPVQVDDLILVVSGTAGTGDGRGLFVINAETGTIVSRHDGPAGSPVAVADGVVYAHNGDLSTNGKIFAFE